MNLKCPQCSYQVSNTAINIQTDLAKCDFCNHVFKISEQIHSELDLEKPRLKPNTQPPQGSRIKVLQEGFDAVAYELPANGLTLESMLMIGFAIVWFFSLTLFSFFGSFFDSQFSLFSIPFWGAGLFVVAFAVNMITEKQKFTLLNTSLQFEKKRILFSKTHTIDYSTIYDVKEVTKTHHSKDGTRVSVNPMILTGADEISFFERASQAEKEWMIALLKSKLS